MNSIVKFFKRIFIFLFASADQQSNIYFKAIESGPYDAEMYHIICDHFHGFAYYAISHYNAQLDILKQDKIARATTSDVPSLCVDYFARNRSRLFEWWCMKQPNELTLNYEFKVLFDVYGFNYAFSKMINKMFGIVVKPDEKPMGVCMIDEYGNVNQQLLQLMNH